MRRRLVESRTAAQAAIAEGLVEVAGVPRPKAATLVDPGASVRLREPPARYVGRGGLKLEAALDAFGVVVGDRSALDVGASTGGFTDCLLQRGARCVVALDVGYGQLHWRLRRDRRVTVVERTNVRHATPEAVGGPFDLVVADLSFISLATVAPSLASLGSADADWVLLVKPQFEVGKADVGSGGVVREPALHLAALRAAVAALANAGLGAHGVVASPIMGAKGNREFFVWVRRGPAAIGDDDLEAVTA